MLSAFFYQTRFFMTLSSASHSIASKMKRFALFAALLLQPFLAYGEDNLVCEVEKTYQDAQMEGPANEFYAYQDYMNMFLRHPLAAWEIRGIIEDIFKTFDSYWFKLKKASRKHLEEDVSLFIRESVSPIAQRYSGNRELMTKCLLLGLFGIGEVEDTESFVAIQKLVVEIMVKKRIAAVLYENDQEKITLLNKCLEQEKLQRLLQICSDSSDYFLHDQVFLELNGRKRMNDYVQGFDLTLIKTLSPYMEQKEGLTSGQEEILGIYQSFSEEIERLKVEYGAFLDFS